MAFLKPLKVQIQISQDVAWLYKGLQAKGHKQTTIPDTKIPNPKPFISYYVYFQKV